MGPPLLYYCCGKEGGAAGAAIDITEEEDPVSCVTNGIIYLCAYEVSKCIWYMQLLIACILCSG